MKSTMTFTNSVTSDHEEADIPASMQVTIERERAIEIVRMAKLVSEHDLYAASHFDLRAEWTDSDGEDVRTDIDRIEVSETEFWFTSVLKHSDIEIQSERTEIRKLIEPFGLPPINRSKVAFPGSAAIAA